MCAGGRERILAADISKPAEVRRLAKDDCDFDVLINNAGLALFGPTAEFDVERFDALFAGNVRAPFMLVAALAPGMAARSKGSHVHIARLASVIGLAWCASYRTTYTARSSLACATS